MNRFASVKSANFNKTAVQNSDQKVSKELLLSRPHWLLVIAVTHWVFLEETLILISIHPLHNISTRIVALLDASILIILLSPNYYLLVFLHLVSHIDEQKRTEHALRASELRFQTIFQTNPDANIIAWMPHGLRIKINPIGKSNLRILRIQSVDFA